MANVYQDKFEATVRQSNWQEAFDRMNGLPMDAMLQSLAHFDANLLMQLYGRRFAYRLGTNMPRMEWAMTVVRSRQLPLIAPGDLLRTRQVSDGARFLGVVPPSRPRKTIKIRLFTTDFVTNTTVMAQDIQKANRVFADQGNGFALDVDSQTNLVPFGKDLNPLFNPDTDDIQNLIDNAVKVSPVLGDRLMVIACTFNRLLAAQASGFTRSDLKNFRQKVVMIDTNRYYPALSRLVHEIGHAAGLEHPEDEEAKKVPVLSLGDPTNVMLKAPVGETSTLTVGQGEKIAGAFFTY